MTLIPPDEIATTTITAEEQLRGRLAQIKKASTTEALAIAHRRFRQAIYDLAKLNILEFDSAAIAVFEDLKRQRLRVGSQDLRIAAIAIANGAIVVTRNRVDFGQIAGLQDRRLDRLIFRSGVKSAFPTKTKNISGSQRC